ncbi:MAG: PAS domain-containing protein, partial [Chloroflexi bacterium]|nr:PAS domain-containing protein [Chloroflexota bacterium]
MNEHLSPWADPATLEAIPAGVCFLDARDFRVIAHNFLYQSLLAEPYRTTGAVGLRIAEFLPGVEEAGMLDCHRQVTLTGEPCVARPCAVRDFPYRGFAHGLAYWVVLVSPVRVTRGEVRWQLATVWEVTERV